MKKAQMMKLVKGNLARGVAKIGELEAIYGAESACVFFLYQPKEPEALTRKMQDRRR